MLLMKLEQQFAEGSFEPPGFFCANDFSSHTSGCFSKSSSPAVTQGAPARGREKPCQIKEVSAFLPLIDEKQTAKSPRVWIGMDQGPGDGYGASERRLGSVRVRVGQRAFIWCMQTEGRVDSAPTLHLGIWTVTPDRWEQTHEGDTPEKELHRGSRIPRSNCDHELQMAELQLRQLLPAPTQSLEYICIPMQEKTRKHSWCSTRE